MALEFGTSSIICVIERDVKIYRHKHVIVAPALSCFDHAAALSVMPHKYSNQFGLGAEKSLIVFIITTYTRLKDGQQFPPIKKRSIDKQIGSFDRQIETHIETMFRVHFCSLLTFEYRQKVTVFVHHGRKIISSEELVSLKPDSSESEFSRLITLAGGGTFSCCCLC